MDGFKGYKKLEQRYKVRAENFDPEGNPDHLLWLHKILSNLKAFIAGTFHGLDKKHLTVTNKGKRSSLLRVWRGVKNTRKRCI
jgi:hypothetical protein